MISDVDTVLILIPGLSPGMSKDGPVGGGVRAPWNVLRQAQDEGGKVASQRPSRAREVVKA